LPLNWTRTQKTREIRVIKAFDGPQHKYLFILCEKKNFFSLWLTTPMCSRKEYDAIFQFNDEEEGDELREWQGPVIIKFG
jgi:hypothetical protein